MTVFLESFNHTQVFARYGLFKVDGPESYYKLTLGDYSGTAGKVNQIKDYINKLKTFYNLEGTTTLRLNV